MTTVLIAEDSDTQRRVITGACKSILSNPQIIAAQDTQDAIEAYQLYYDAFDKPPDLVITDLNVHLKHCQSTWHTLLDRAN